MATKFDKDTTIWTGSRNARVKTIKKNGMAMQSIKTLVDYMNSSKPVPKRVHKVRNELTRRGVEIQHDGEKFFI